MSDASRISPSRAWGRLRPAAVPHALTAAHRRWPTAVGAFPTTFGTNLFIQVVTLGSGIVLARSLGADGRGELAAAMLWPPLLASLGDLGQSEAVTYFAGRETERKSRVLTTALLLGVARAAALMAIGLLLLPFVLAGRPAATVQVALLYLWIIPLGVVTLLPVSMLQGRMDLLAYNLARTAPHVSYTLLLTVLWAFAAVGVASAATASLLSVLLTFVACSWLIVRGGYWTRQVAPSLIGPMLTFGAKLHLGNLAGIAASRLDVIVLTMLVPSDVLGLYVVAFTVGNAADVLPAAAATVLYPRVIGRPLADVRMVLARVLLTGAVLVVATVPVLAIVAVPVLVRIFFGPEFAEAVPLARVLLLASVLRGGSAVLAAVMRGAGWPLRASVGHVIGLTVLGLVLPPLVLRFSGLGTAAAMVLSALATFGWMIVQVCRSAGVTPSGLARAWRRDVARLPALLRSLKTER